MAQIRLIFQPVNPDPCSKSDFFAYVELFQPTRGQVEDGVHVKDSVVGLPRVVRQLSPDGLRRGLVVDLTDIWRPIDLVPNFEEVDDDEAANSTVMDSAKEFFVNYYYDKRTFEQMY